MCFEWITVGPSGSKNVVFVGPNSVTSMSWASTINVTGSGLLTIGQATMTTPTAVLTTITTVTISTGSLQGLIVSTVASSVTLSATVGSGNTLALGPCSGLMTLYGTLTAVGTINVYSLVVVDGSTKLGNGGTGVVLLDGCVVNSGTGSVAATVLSTYSADHVNVLRMQCSGW